MFRLTQTQTCFPPRVQKQRSWAQSEKKKERKEKKKSAFTTTQVFKIADLVYTVLYTEQEKRIKRKREASLDSRFTLKVMKSRKKNGCPAAFRIAVEVVKREKKRRSRRSLTLPSILPTRWLGNSQQRRKRERKLGEERCPRYRCRRPASAGSHTFPPITHRKRGIVKGGANEVQRSAPCCLRCLFPFLLFFGVVVSVITVERFR